MREIEEQFTSTELQEYEDSIKAYRDLKNSIDFAEEKGIDKGIEIGLAKGKEIGQKEGLMIAAKNMKSNGMVVADIAKMLGLSEKEIAKL